MNERQAKITIDFCDAIFEACPWAAPEGYQPPASRKTIEQVFDQLFGIRGAEL